MWIGRKLLFCTLICALNPAALHASSLVSQVASCTGRVSALLEHHWASDNPNAALTENLHEHLTDVFETLLEADTDRYARGVRTDSKLAFRKLIALANAADALRQQRLAEDKVNKNFLSCAELVLGADKVRAMYPNSRPFEAQQTQRTRNSSG